MSSPESSWSSVPSRPTRIDPVALSEIAAHLSVPMPSEESEPGSVTGVSQSSHAIRPGDLYAALPGARTHGACFAVAAADAGAVACLTDSEGASIARDSGLPTLVVPTPRAVLGSVASFVYGHPSLDVTLIGVTGTQGKTTTTQLINAGLAGADRRTAVIGTMGTWINGQPVKSALTTPEAPDLHALFAVMRERGVQVCAIEVSSHAIVMGRVDGVVFDLAVFTNFGRDHLDFHASVEDYFAAKADLFTPQRAKRALLNGDDPYVARLVTKPQIPTHTFSATSGDADWRCSAIEANQTSSTFTVDGPDGLHVSTSIALAGSFNVTNGLTALASIGEIGLDVTQAAARIASVPAVPGRMERVDVGQEFSVIVDYAHKPDAVSATLEALRPVTAGQLIIVIGAGGDRDQGKRALMGEIAARLSDMVIVTDDNPRTEDPAAIRAEVIAGVTAGPGLATVIEIGDRKEAIAQALSEAKPGDTILIAGKGHETGQDVAGEMLDFDDREVARSVLVSQQQSGAGR